MASILKIKRSSVQGKKPTTSNITTGELALNVRDSKLFSSDGSSVFEVGANLAISSIGTLTVGNTNPYTLPTSIGTNGQALVANTTSGELEFKPGGAKGQKGQAGADGSNGSDGAKGQKGETGAAGSNGSDG